MARLLALCLSLVLVGIAAGQTEPTPQLPFNPCPLCQMATGMLDKQLKAVEDITQTIGATLMQACSAAAVCEDACQFFVHQYAGLFAYGFSVAEYSLDGFCAGVFFCPPPSYQMMTQNGVFETACGICQQTITTIVGSLTSEAIAAQAQKRITQICSAPLVDKEQCMAIIGSALMQAMETTKAVLDPKTFCTAVGPCAIAKAPPPTSSEAPAEESNPTIVAPEAKATYPVA